MPLPFVTITPRRHPVKGARRRFFHPSLRSQPHDTGIRPFFSTHSIFIRRHYALAASTSRTSRTSRTSSPLSHNQSVQTMGSHPAGDRHQEQHEGCRGMGPRNDTAIPKPGTRGGLDGQRVSTAPAQLFSSPFFVLSVLFFLIYPCLGVCAKTGQRRPSLADLVSQVLALPHHKVCATSRFSFFRHLPFLFRSLH